VANVGRAVVGSFILSVGEREALRFLSEFGTASFGDAWIVPSALLTSFGVVFVRLFFAYAAISVSDYMFHRFIWHAHWARNGDGMVLWKIIHLHYVQHYLAHHKHSIDKDAIPKMRALVQDPRNPSRKEAIEVEAARATDKGAQFVLECSQHGFTVGGFHCRFATAGLQLLLPTGTCILVAAMQNDWVSILCHALSTLLPLYLVIHHDKYHCSPEARVRWAETEARNWFERWFWKTAEIGRIAEDHLEHHHGERKHGERFFGLLPWYCYAVFPIWQTW
jgi:hypothetical protein